MLSEEYKIDEPSVSLITANEENMIEYKTDNNVVDFDSVYRISYKNPSAYTNLSKSYLELQFSLVKEADGSAYNANDRVTLRKGALSLFTRAVLRINQNVVETCEDVALSKTLQSLLLFSQDYSSSAATNQFWSKDTGNLGTDANATRPYNHAAVAGQAANALNIVENPDYNSGFVERELRTRSSAVVTAYIPVAHLFGFCSVNKLLSNQEISIELTKSQSSQHIHRLTATDAGKVKVNKLSWWLPNVLPKASVDLALKSQMSSGLQSEFTYYNWNAYTSPNLNAGENTFKVLTTSEDIQYAFVVMRNTTKTQDSAAEHTYRSDIQACESRLNGRNFPNRRYDQLMNGANANGVGVSRVYSELLRHMNKSNNYADGIQLSYNEFVGNNANGSQGQMIIPFDFTNKPDNFAGSPTNLEILITPSATAVGDNVQCSVVVVSKRTAMLSYSGNKATISVA